MSPIPALGTERLVDLGESKTYIVAPYLKKENTHTQENKNKQKKPIKIPKS